MPELPDVHVYVERLDAHVRGHVLRRVRMRSAFLLRSVDPPLSSADGRVVRSVERLGKRIVLGLGEEVDAAPDLFLVLHLMIAGRLRWKSAGAAVPGKVGLAAFDFDGSEMHVCSDCVCSHFDDSGHRLTALDAPGTEDDITTIVTGSMVGNRRAQRHRQTGGLNAPGYLLAPVGVYFSRQI